MKNYCEAGATVHGIRHASRDRLRAVEAPVDLVDQLGGWSAKSVGTSYGDGYDLRIARYHISLIWPCGCGGVFKARKADQ